MHFLKIHWRCINAVGYVQKRHAPRCIHKMQAILSVKSTEFGFELALRIPLFVILPWAQALAISLYDFSFFDYSHSFFFVNRISLYFFPFLIKY